MYFCKISLSKRNSVINIPTRGCLYRFYYISECPSTNKKQAYDDVETHCLTLFITFKHALYLYLCNDILSFRKKFFYNANCLIEKNSF